MGMMNPMMMGGMGGMGMMNPMMMGGMGGMGMMGGHHMNIGHMMNMMRNQMYGGAPMVGSMSNMGKQAGKINPMFNVNMGYMMGRAVKKCQPLKNGLEICAMYNPMTNQLNVDVKCKNCKKLKKGTTKRLFPKQLSKMIKMLVKQRVFGSAGDQLLGGGLERRFRRATGTKRRRRRKKKKKKKVKELKV